MPLEAPNLDTRTFDQLVQEARLRIPRYTPEWTDFNESDPGMVLVQLFAWFTETMLVEMNRVPERSYIKFLQLLDMQLRPAEPATAHLTFSPQAGAATGTVLKGTQVAAPGPLIFETEADLDLVRLPLTDVVVFDGAGFQNVTPANESGGASFRPLGWIPAPGSALYLGFTPAATPVADPFPRKIALRVFLPTGAGEAHALSANEVKNPPPPPVDLVWEYRPAANPARWQRLAQLGDESLAFTREGYIQIEGPRDAAPTKEAGRDDLPRLWLRCRLDRRSYPAGREPEIAFLRTNTVDARNLSTVRDEDLLRDDGTALSDGSPGQVFVLRRKPVFVPQPDDGVGGSLELVLEADDGATEAWTRVPDLFASQKDDPHYVLDPTAGTIRTGDGARGRIPTAGSRFVARSYRWGGGSAGNVGPETIAAPLTSLTGVEKVTNVRPAVGGRDEQSVEELKESAPHELRSRNRAVTASDFAAIALDAGGVARATALPLWHPAHPGVDVPGAVTVVVLPDNREPNPTPTADQLTAVSRYLDGFRLLTTELFVAPPAYTPISVQATVQVQPYASFDRVVEEVTARIDAYLDPRSWPFGRPLHPTNLYAVILAVPDVIQVPRLELAIDGAPQELTQPVPLPPDGLFYGKGHLITVSAQ